MSTRHSQGVRAAICTLLADTTFADCVIDLYDTAQPANPNTAPGGTKVGSITESGGAFAHGSATNALQFDATAVDGTMSITGGETWRFTAARAGTVRWGRIKTNATDDDSTSTTQARIDFSVGASAGFDMILTKTTFDAAAETADVSVFTYTQPIGD